MKVDFDLLPGYSRIWIYQSDRPFTPQETELVGELSDEFLTEWTAHGHELKAAARILYDHFLILSVNEKINGVSGCSIDASVRFIREIESRLNIVLTDRSKIAFLKHGDVRMTDLRSIKNEIENQSITRDTLIFNNLVQTKGALKDQWLVPAGESWMKKYFNINTGKTHE
ncbi:MAG: hypothetical protein KFF73_08710 [Cyclobacteriaceae bacterium]|nr:hypothetical protein [Cyclobacteriaceae bacterium]